MGIKLSWGSGQMGPARRPRPVLFIKKKKKKKGNPPPPRGFARGGRYGMGVGRWAGGPDVFQTRGSQLASLVAHVPRVNCLACAWDSCFVYRVFLKRGVHVQKG